MLFNRMRRKSMERSNTHRDKVRIMKEAMLLKILRSEGSEELRKVLRDLMQGKTLIES